MSVNGITTNQSVDYSAYTSNTKATATETKAETTAPKNDTGVVYEKSEEAAVDSAKKTYTPNTELISKLKANTCNFI